MDYRRNDMKFIKTNSTETRHKLLYEGFTEITEPNATTFVFLNDGKKLNFDAEMFGCTYTNVLHI